MIERYEFKYLVTEKAVAEIRRTVLALGARDPNAGSDGSYTIRSLYLDTPQHHLYWANDRQAHDRFKARIRTYPGKPAPTFFEIKRRTGDVIRKTRGVVTGNWAPVIHGDMNVACVAHTRPAFERFVEKTQRFHLEPTQLVQYEREAFASSIDAYARVTIDRRIVGQQLNEWTLDADEHRWRPIDVGLVADGLRESTAVLELKFERRPPRWMVAMVTSLGLRRRGFSKYAYTLDTQLKLPERREPSGQAGEPKPYPERPLTIPT